MTKADRLRNGVFGARGDNLLRFPEYRITSGKRSGAVALGRELINDTIEASKWRT